MSPLVVGVSGVTCGGKTSISRLLASSFPQGSVLNQDDFYFKENNPSHIVVQELNHINWEVVSAFDMERFQKRVQDFKSKSYSMSNDNRKEANRILSVVDASSSLQNLSSLLCNFERPILFLDGITIFNHPPSANICDLKYFFTLDYDECRRRRQTRVYDPPDVPMYFEKIVWPYYLKNLDDIKTQTDINFIDGKNDVMDTARSIIRQIMILSK